MILTCKRLSQFSLRLHSYYYKPIIILDHNVYASYVAAKTMYFGVGGGVLPFKQLVEADGIFNIEVVFNVTHNVKREVLELRYK